MNRLKTVLKNNGINQKILAHRLGITPGALKQRMNNPTLSSIDEVAAAIPCEIHELFETSEDFAHFYDKGEWLGIRRKR